MATVESDAVPFDIPEEETEEKKTEKPEPEPESKPKSKTKEEPKYKSKKKDFFSDSSDDSDSDDDGFFRRASKNSGQNILIHKGRNIHIGNSYNFTQVRTAVSNINIKKNKNPPSEFGPQFTESTKRKLPDEIKDSVREIDPEAMHFVAEHIASDWKKLARYLPPR
ncbi:autophagy-related protein 18-like isoform X2 [Centruroides sculpturatus]|uniref:autophagy-related protein 18-like isoform X2 n=1 Tax=Centruroides sculpturatus TaxID=218467 RepID=UPI000C6D5D4A|nr:autophagy-related protein 18-like isoform X2 [Centruroides sculpturatus]